jgi:hypothetical protein
MRKRCLVEVVQRDSGFEGNYTREIEQKIMEVEKIDFEKTVPSRIA